MGQVLHSSATTTQAVRRAIQNSQESLRTLAKRYGINQKTVAKWKKRTSVDDLQPGQRILAQACYRLKMRRQLLLFENALCCH